VLIGVGLLLALVAGFVVRLALTGDDDRAGPTTTSVAAAALTFQDVVDDTNTVRVRVPTAWSNVWGDGWHPGNLPPFEGRIGPGLNASPNNAGWRDDLTTPGLFLGASSQLAQSYTPSAVVRRTSIGSCRTSDGGSYRSPRYDGEFLRLTCPGTETTWYVMAAWPADHAYIVALQVKFVDDADRRALDEILASFEVSGTP
jgi:hypothetical protein